MLQRNLFTKVLREFPKDEESLNAKLLTRAGFIKKLSAGVYSYLPFGRIVLQRINNIVRAEMNALGAEELLMPSLISKSLWEKTGRFDVEVVYKLKDASGSEFGLGWTHEEVVSDIARHHIASYGDLPKAVYQIQTKFRAEARAKSGLLRGREFLMKDLYSFHADEADLDAYYQKVIVAYKRICERLELPFKITEASGGAFTKEFTHEFQVISPAGEDVILHCSECDFSQNKEVSRVKAGDKCSKCGMRIAEDRAIEVANVFKLGTKYSEALGVTYVDKNGKRNPVIMGSYGIGPSRIMGTLVEIYNDEKGIVWPKAVAPYEIHLIELGGKKSVKDNAGKIYRELSQNGFEVLYDDREDVSAGGKFAEADLIGIPWRVVISEKTGDKAELKKRKDSDIAFKPLKSLSKFFKSAVN